MGYGENDCGYVVAGGRSGQDRILSMIVVTHGMDSNSYQHISPSASIISMQMAVPMIFHLSMYPLDWLMVWCAIYNSNYRRGCT